MHYPFALALGKPISGVFFYKMDNGNVIKIVMAVLKKSERDEVIDYH